MNNETHITQKSLPTKLGIGMFFILLIILLSSCSPKTSFSMKITSPSDANGPVTPGHSFYINGEFESNTPLPEDAKLRVSVYSGDKELRFAQSNHKNQGVIDKFNSKFFYYADDVDPNRTSLDVASMPYLIVEDENNPEASFQNANIKCYFTDNEFTAFIPYATDAKHGLIFNDGIGYLDENGNIYTELGCSEYIAKAVLTDSNGNEISSCEKTFKIEPAKDTILCRFHPDEHYDNMMAFAAKNNLSMNIDWIPGYYKDPNGNDKGGLREMFIGGDVALYKNARTHMFIYLTDPKSTSLTLEIPYLEKYSNIDDPSVFTAYCYDCGEPVLKVNNKTIKGKITQIKDNDKLYLCRTDVTTTARDGYLDLKNYNITQTDTDFSDGINLNSTDGQFAISGVVVPHQLKSEEIVFDPVNNDTGLLNFAENIVYEFTSSSSKKSYKKKIELVRLLDDENHSEYPSKLEFYHVFDMNDFEPGEEYTVNMYCEDMNGNPIKGTQESFNLKLK